MTIRLAGKRGRLPAKKLPLRYAHEYLAVPRPAPVYPIDVAGGIQNWGMLGNDQFGNCGVAGELHIEMSTAVGAGVPVPQFTEAQAVKEYLTYTGGQDDGVVLADFLKWCYDQKKILAFAPLDYTDIAQCDAFTAAGFGTYDGVALTDDADQLFNEGKPWTTANGETPDPNEGHCIVSVGATGPASTDLDTYVTWGALQKATRAWTIACTEERWLVVTTEEQLAKFTPDLLADVAALGGTGGVTPAPTPTPTPTPTPDAADAALAAVAKPWIAEWHPWGSNRKMATALKVWLAAKGL